MTDISRFGFAIDSSQVVNAFENLDRMAESSRQMEARASRLERATNDMTRRLTDLVRQQESYNRHTGATISYTPAVIDSTNRMADSYARLSAQILAVNQAMAVMEEQRYRQDRSRGSFGSMAGGVASMMWRGSTEPLGAWRMMGEFARERIDSLTGAAAEDPLNHMQDLSREAELLGRIFEVTAGQLRLYEEATAGLTTSSRDVAQLINHIGSVADGTNRQVAQLRRTLQQLGLDMDDLIAASDVERVNLLGQSINQIENLGERNRVARELGFSPELLADTRIGLREIGEEQRKLMALEEAGAQQRQRWEEQQTRRQRDRLEILKEISAQDSQRDTARAIAMDRLGQAWTELWQGPNEPTASLFQRLNYMMEEAGEKLGKLARRVGDVFRATVDPLAYGEDVLKDEAGDGVPTQHKEKNNHPSFMQDELLERLRAPDVMMDFEEQARLQLEFAQDYLASIREHSDYTVEHVLAAEEELHRRTVGYWQIQKSQIAQGYQFRLSTALTALGREKMALQELELMKGDIRYGPQEILQQDRHARMMQEQSIAEREGINLMFMRDAGQAEVAEQRLAEAGTNRAVQTGQAPRVAATGAALETARTQYESDMAIAQEESINARARLKRFGIDPKSAEGQRYMAQFEQRERDIRRDYETTRRMISLQAGLNADMQQYQEERRALLTQDSLMWAEHLPEKRRLQERLAQAEIEVAEEYGRGTEAYAQAFARRAAVIEQNSRDEAELGLRGSIGDLQREVELNEGLADAIEQGGRALNEFNIARQMSLAAAAMAAAGHDLESEAVQALLEDYERLLNLQQQQAAQQQFAATKGMRRREIDALRMETNLAQEGTLPMERQMKVALLRERQRLEDMGLPEEKVNEGVEQYRTLLNEQSIRDFETNKSDRLINAARNVAGRIEDTLSQGLVNAAAMGTEGFESFFHDIGQMAQQTAAEIMRAMVIQPMIGAGLKGIGLGNVAMELGYMAFTMHSGGIAGSDGAMRMVPTSAIAGAPRYHSGTGSAGGPATGLAPNEVLTILQKGERVLPENSSAGGMNVVNNITVNNSGGGQDEAGSERLAKTIAKQIDTHLERKMAAFAVRQRRVGGVFGGS